MSAFFTNKETYRGVIQGIITILIIGGDVIIYLKYGAIPEILVNITLIIIGFWFGDMTSSNIQSKEG